MNACELYDMLSEYLLSIKMHNKTLTENKDLKNQNKILLYAANQVKRKLEEALSQEKIQRQRAIIAEREIKEDRMFSYKRGDIFNVSK